MLANEKTYLNDRYAKKEVKEQVIRADQLIATIRRMNAESKLPKSTKKEMLGFGEKCWREIRVKEKIMLPDMKS